LRLGIILFRPEIIYNTMKSIFRLGILMTLWSAVNCKPMDRDYNVATFEYLKLDGIKDQVSVADIDNDGLNDIIKKGDKDQEPLVWYKFREDNSA